MNQDERLAAARARRRVILGDEYVDRLIEDSTPAGAEFQEFVTSTAWGVWARGDDVLSPRDRSLLVLAILAVIGRMEEFELHVAASPNAGVTDAELDELLFQIAAYGGVPAGVSANRVIKRVRADKAAK